MSPQTPRAPRRGHLREVRDGLPTVPELLATDALLDRLARHEATDGDLHDTVARILDTYALNADPETAGVRPLAPSALEEVLAEPEVPAPLRAPRVLTARRRTLERIGRGGVAAAAVLALMGGTAAAAATGGGNVLASGGPAGSVSASTAAGLPDWVPDAVFDVFGGSTEQRAQNTIAQARQLAASGDPVDRAKAQATVNQVVADLKVADVPGDVLASAMAQVAMLGTPVDTTAVAPTAPLDSLLVIGSANRTVAVPSPSSTWRAPQVSPTTTTTPTTAPTTTPAPTGVPTTVPVPAPVTTRPTTPGTSTPPPVTVTTPPPTSGGGGGPSTPVPDGPTTPAPDPGTEAPPTDGGTTAPVPVEPTTPTTTAPVVVPTEGETGTGTAVAPVVTTEPEPIATPVVVPSPEAGVAPSPTVEVPVVSTSSTDSSTEVSVDAGTTGTGTEASTSS